MFQKVILVDSIKYNLLLLEHVDTNIGKIFTNLLVIEKSIKPI